MKSMKDYCDNETSRELKELGFPTKVTFIGEQATIEIPINSGLIHLYEAQKWLRKEKDIIVEANFSLMYKGRPRFEWRVLYNLAQHKGAYYTFDSVKSKEDYDSSEEALSEGIKETVKLLKEKADEKDIFNTM